MKCINILFLRENFVTTKIIKEILMGVTVLHVKIIEAIIIVNIKCQSMDVFML